MLKLIRWCNSHNIDTGKFDYFFRIIVQLLRNQAQPLQPHGSQPEDLPGDRQGDQQGGQLQSQLRKVRLQKGGKTQVSIYQ